MCNYNSICLVSIIFNFGLWNFWDTLQHGTIFITAVFEANYRGVNYMFHKFLSALIK
jgi:hypothetical protein